MTETLTPKADEGPEDGSTAATTTSKAGWWAALSGLLAAAAALATGEIMSGFSQTIPSLVVGIAEIFTAETPGGVVRWSIDTFGTSQKTLLTTGITISSLLVGAYIGWASLKDRRVGTIGFAAFGILGGWAAARASLSADGWSWIAAILSAAVGAVVLRSLIKWLPFKRTAETGLSALTSTPDRRNFLGVAGGAAFFAMFGSGLGKALRNNQSVEGAREAVAARLPTPSPTPIESVGAATTPVTAAANFDGVDGIAPYITPNDDFYLIDTAIRKPQVDPASWSMRVTGMVDNELEFTFDDLLAMEHIEETITLSCVSNQVGGKLVGNAVWTGVPLKTLLDMAGVQPGADQLASYSVDGWSCGFPTEIAVDGRPAMVAITMNGEPLPVIHGFPARLVIPGLYGYVSATKWLSEIQLTTQEDFNGYWIPRGWGKEGPIKTQSRIDVPRQGETISPGPIAIAGVAWAPHRSIDRVEVQVDETGWIDAVLSEELTTNSWRQWMIEWDAVPGDHMVWVRATDGDGIVQTEERSRPDPDGATGHHAIAIRVQA
jgi:DMSO/TMAO reductase YedYZ molybdopterin-dependent catalytic subunit